MARNRRRFTRVRAQGMAAHLSTQQGRTACQVENISRGGVFVRTDALLEVGAELAVDLVKPGWKKQIALRARVSSRAEAMDAGGRKGSMPGLGLQFVQLDAAQHERLRALLRELGAPDEGAEVTLPEDALEAELRALDPKNPDGGALDPQPEPAWQQVQLVEEAIASAVADLPAPEPLTLTPALPPEQGVQGAELARLQIQLRGLVMQLSDAQQQLAGRDAEIERLRDQLESARTALDRALRDR